MRYNICICEDEPQTQESLTQVVKQYFDNRHLSHEIKCYTYGVVLLADYKDGSYNPDILLINIHLPKSNGINICKELRALKYDGIILFVTGDHTHAIHGYEVDARAYLLKPFDKDKIYSTFDRILANSNMRAYYIIKTHHRIVKIPKSQIIYIESIKNQCVVHCKDDIEYTIYKKLSDVEKELDDNHFLRCHQSYLINMDYIEQATDDFQLSSGDIIPIRKHEIKTIKEKYMTFVSSI